MPWYSLLAVSAVMALAWCWQVRRNNAGIVDAIWALSIAALALFYAVSGDGSWSLRLLVAAAMGGWYLRLGSYLWYRVCSEPEDGRYQYLRQHWGRRAHAYHFVFFQLQALLAWLFSLPAWLIASANSDGLAVQHYAAIAVVVIAFIGVTIADKQLALFRRQSENRGQVCQLGLWNYSRHPNYFFEWLHWFSYPLMAIGIAGGGWLWLVPVAMLLFLVFITGIPYTEQQAVRSRGQRYIDYQKTTSVFIPWKKRSL